MNSSGKPHVHYIRQNNVGGNVDMPPALCLRAACLSAYSAARVEGTGRLRRRASCKTGLAGRGIENSSICHLELFK